MPDQNEAAVAVWMLAAEDTAAPPWITSDAMTPEQLSTLRSYLAECADNPIATLEAQPLPDGVDRSHGFALGSDSPLAKYLSALMEQAVGSDASANPGAGDETLYRMVVPAKVAAQVGGGLIKPMASKAADRGIHSALVGPSGIAGQATFIPAAGSGILTMAAPLMLMTVAVGISAYIEHQRREITALVEKLRGDLLARERAELNGCLPAIDSATGVVLDKGHIGHALGLGPAVNTINVAIAAAQARVTNWQRALDHFGDNRVELGTLLAHFPGIDGNGGEFRAHLELADLAISLNKRVLVLQAVDQAQLDPGNALDNFMKALKRNHKQVAELEVGITDVLSRLSRVRVDRGHGIREVMIHMGDVDRLLGTADRLRELDAGAMSRQSDVAIEMVKEKDGSVVVLPAYQA